LFRRFSERETQKVLFNYTGVEFVSKSERRRFRHILFLLALFLATNLGVFAVSSYLYNNPRETWWSLRSQLTDLGFWGHFYAKILPQKKSIADRSEDDFLTKIKVDWQKMQNLTVVDQTKKLALPILTKPNILLVQLESVQNWAIENSVTPMPFLKKLLAENLTVPDFHSSSCETINAEFGALCGFWPRSDRPISGFLQNEFTCLPDILRNEEEYATYFFHANVAEFWNRDKLISAFGFEKTFFSPYFDSRLDDKRFYEQILSELKKETKPFFAHAVTILSHSPHSDEVIEFQNRVHQSNVRPFVEKIDDKITENIKTDKKTLRNYFGFLRAVDDGLKYLFTEIDKDDFFANTVVILYADHRFYNFVSENKLQNFQMYNRLPVAIVLPDKQQGRLAQIGSQMDLAPTILQLIEGADYRERENFFGQSFFSPKHQNLAVNKCLGQVYLQSENFTIVGNASTNQYETIFSSEIERKNELMLESLKNLITDSDAVLDNDEFKETEQSSN
ncbi:MAG: LTA synthase family protein, partial [Patescibacteria group bacterium]